MTKNQTAPSDISVLMNWARDGNLKSEFPKQLKESKALNAIFFLNFFVLSPKYWIYINDVFNNPNIFRIDMETLYRTFKEIVYYTGYNSFGKKKVEVKENPLIKELKLKFPYYKKEEIIMAVNIIDNSDFKDVVYEQFNLNNKSRVKKMTKKESKDRENKIKNMIDSKDIMDLM